MKDLELVYQAVSKEQAEMELDNLETLNREKTILLLLNPSGITGTSYLLTSSIQTVLEDDLKSLYNLVSVIIDIQDQKIHIFF